jgi:pilus assembly protein Flp/PilA
MLDNLITILKARLDRDEERGASAVEYALLITGIAAVIVIAVFALGVGVFGLFDDSCTTIGTQTGDTC